MEDKLIVISAVWCPSCLILKRQLKKLGLEQDTDYLLYDYDLDEEEIAKYNVGDKLPVLIYKTKRLIGEKNNDELKEFLEGCDLL